MILLRPQNIKLNVCIAMHHLVMSPYWCDLFMTSLHTHINSFTIRSLICLLNSYNINLLAYNVKVWWGECLANLLF